MFNTVKRIAVGLAALSISVGAFAQSDRAMDLDALLKQLEEGQFAQSQQNKQRERDFQAQRSEQDRILRETREKRDQMLAQSEQLETQFEENEFKLADLNGALDTRLGSLKELFGVLQQIAGDTKNKFYNSVVSAQIPGRADFLDKMAQDMGSSSKLASIEEIERVWFEMQREMTEAGKVTTFKTDVVEAGGEKVNKSVVRVGPFALVADGKYLEYNGVTGTVSELVRQPADRYMDSAAELQASSGELVQFGIDPTGGSILGLLVQAPNLQERVEQGGVKTLLNRGRISMLEDAPKIRLIDLLIEKGNAIGYSDPEDIGFWGNVIDEGFYAIVDKFRQGNEATEMTNLADASPRIFDIDPIITKGVANLIWAPGGSYKSYFGLLTCVMIDRGLEILGMKARKGKALFLDWEEEEAVFKSRLYR